MKFDKKISHFQGFELFFILFNCQTSEKLRDRIDYNNKIKAETFEKIQVLLEQKPECRGEIMELLRNYQIEV